MNLSQNIAHVIAESALPPGQCQACERQGLPVLVLRQALVPDLLSTAAAPPLEGRRVDTKMGLRTLRMGYLYVLLDRRIWHAYEVTEQGYLRRYNPIEPPLGPPRPLPDWCSGKDHDIPSAFLTFDTKTYSTAWIAFASDPWPLSVLNAYRDGTFPSDRFHELDLTQLRTNPGRFGMLMTPDNLQVDRQVFEYAKQLPGPFDSAHGFHSRYLRHTALRNYVTHAMAKHQLKQGVLAVVIDDTVGLIQEYNHARLGWLVARQQWREEPLRAYKLQTSHILQIIRAQHRAWAEEAVSSFEPQSGDGPPVFVDPRIERQRVVDQRGDESDARLEERYDEPARAAFQAEYERQDAQYQHYIDLNAQAYAALCDSSAFKLIEQYDYDGQDSDSAVAYSMTLASCLAGGITEALRSEAQAPPGPSEALWLRWLQDPASPAYRALLMRNESLLDALLPSFSTNEVDWNDSEKLYSVLNKFITSDDLGLAFRDGLKQAVADLQGAVNAASKRLEPSLAPEVPNAVRRLNAATQWLHNGVQLIELQVQMKLGEYYALQSAHLRQLQKQANQAVAKAREQRLRSMRAFEAQSLSNLRNVRPILQDGLLSLAVLDPKLADSTISVSLWVEGRAQEVHERLVNGARHGVGALEHAAPGGLVDLTVAPGTLEPDARKRLQGLRITSQQAAQLVRSSFTGLRGIVGSWQLLLGLGGLYLLSDSLDKNLAKAETEIGAKSKEALLALHGTQLALLGGGTEVLGITLREGFKHASASGFASSVFKSGVSLVKAGSIISAAAGLYDATQTTLSIRRTFLAGDENASIGYFIAGTLHILEISLAISAISTPLVLGPLGLAITFGILAYHASNRAGKNESTPLEQWIKRCYFGKANETPVIHWNTPELADIALAELNAATLGLEAIIGFEAHKTSNPTTGKIGGLVSLTVDQSLKFLIKIPDFDENRSGYRWHLVVHRQSDKHGYAHAQGEEIASNEFNPPPGTESNTFILQLRPSHPPKFPDYKKDTIITKKTDHALGRNAKYRKITGAVELNPEIAEHNVKAATLVITYWPNRSIPNAYSEIIRQEIRS